MVKEPTRFHSLAGAAVAAERLGDTAKAKAYYAKLVAMTDSANEPQPVFRCVVFRTRVTQSKYAIRTEAISVCSDGGDIRVSRNVSSARRHGDAVAKPPMGLPTSQAKTSQGRWQVQEHRP